MSTYTGSSIVDYLNSTGQASDYGTRSRLAAQYGISNYTGTAAQNTQLLGSMRGGSSPAPTSSVPVQMSAPFSVSASGSSSMIPPVSMTTQSSTPSYIPPSSSSLATPTITANDITRLRSQMANGSMTPQQALAVVQQGVAALMRQDSGAGIAALKGFTSQLYAPLTIIPTNGGRGGQLNPDGTVSLSGSQVNTSNASVGSGANFNTAIVGGPVTASTYSGPSVVDYLHSVGMPSDYASRAAMAAKLGIVNYSGTAAQNTQMLSTLRNAAAAGTGGPTGTGSTAGVGTATAATAGGLPSTGNSNLDSIQTALSSYLNNQLTNGFQVNPNLQITPDLVSQFLNEAHGQIDPYYQQQLTSEKANINASLSALGAGYQNEQAGQQADFQQGVANEREAAGGSGTAFSGGRGLNESNMLSAQNRSLGAIDTKYAQAIGNTLRTGGSDLGAGIPGLGGGISDVTVPNLGSQRSSLEGPRGGVMSSGGLDLGFNPSIYQYGTVPSNYASSLTGQSNAFLSNYQQSAANNSARSFQNINGVPTLM